MAGVLDFAYTPHLAHVRAFGRAWCGPASFEHGKRTLVAVYPPEGDGQGVHVFCTALPATFYELVVSPGVNSGGEASPGYVVTTGSSMHQWAADTAKAIAEGMAGFKPRVQ